MFVRHLHTFVAMVGCAAVTDEGYQFICNKQTSSVHGCTQDKPIVLRMAIGNDKSRGMADNGELQTM